MDFAKIMLASFFLIAIPSGAFAREPVLQEFYAVPASPKALPIPISMGEFWSSLNEPVCESLLIANLSIRRGGHTPLIHDRVVADACRSMSRQLLVTDRAVCRVHGLLRGRDMHAAGWVFVGGIFRCV